MKYFLKTVIVFAVLQAFVVADTKLHCWIFIKLKINGSKTSEKKYGPAKKETYQTIACVSPSMKIEECTLPDDSNKKADVKDYFASDSQSATQYYLAYPMGVSDASVY